jgi:hypothetical protein
VHLRAKRRPSGGGPLYVCRIGLDSLFPREAEFSVRKKGKMCIESRYTEAQMIGARKQLEARVADFSLDKAALQSVIRSG